MNVKVILSTCCPKSLRPLFDRIENSEVSYRLAKGMFWSLVGAIISRGLMLLASIVVARLIGKTGYGELGMIQTTVGMFGVFAGFGLGLTATKHVAEFRKSDPERAGRIISLAAVFAIATGGLMALGLFISAPWLAEHTLNAPHLKDLLRISSVMLFINALNGAQNGALSGFEAFKTITHVNLFVGLLSFPILLCGTYFGGLTGAVWALSINLSINWILNHIALRMESRRNSVPFNIKKCGREWPLLWKFSLPAALTSSLVGPVNWYCASLLVSRTNGYGEMGIYSAANQWLIMLLYIPNMFGRVLLPLLSEQLGKNNGLQAVKAYFLAIKVNSLLVIPFVLLVSIASPHIMSFYGESFKEGWPTLIVVVLTAGLLSIQMPIGQIIVAAGKIWIGFLMNLGWSLAFIAGTLLLLDHGALGLASSRAIAYALHTAWTFGFAYIYISKKTKNDF